MRSGAATARGAARRHRAAASIGVVLVAALGVTGCGQQTPAGTAAANAAANPATTAAANAGADTGGSTTKDETTRNPYHPRVVRLDAGEDRPRLTCPDDERSLMIADFAVGARGARTPQAAVGLSSLEPDERMVVSSRGTRVWILREDGTAREEIHLTHLRGWLLHMREACA